MLYLCKKEIALFMAKNKRANKTLMDMALIEYVRCGYSAWQASKITNVHHQSIKRAWDKLSEEERAIYVQRADTVADIVENTIIAQEVAVISETTARLKKIGNLALDELESRLSDDLRRFDMKDADLINIATKCLTLADENTRRNEEEKKVTVNVGQMFNLIDNSIQDNLTQHRKYEKD